MWVTTCSCSRPKKVIDTFTSIFDASKKSEKNSGLAMPRPASEIISASLDLIKARLYDGRPWAARYWPERDMLIRAITWLATWFNQRGVAPSSQRYSSIVALIVTDIDRHMRIDRPKCMALYFHHCLQKHMRHQGEIYYEQAKATRNVIQAVTSTLTARQRQIHADQAPVETLADIYRQLRSKPRRPRGKSA